MNFSLPPNLEDFQVIAHDVIETLPHELSIGLDDLVIEVEDFPDEAVEDELDLDDPYEALALFRSGKEITPGVEKKSGKDDDLLILYRRPILDLWCETCDDLSSIVRQVVIEELARNMGFSDDDVEELVSRHHQGML